MLLVSAAAPFFWVQTGRSGKVRRSGTVEGLQELARLARGESTYAVIPGEHLVTHKVSVPARSRSRVEQALPYALEERLTEDIEDFHFAILGWKPGGDVLAGVVARQQAEQWLARFEEAGIGLTGMLADYQLLPLHPRCTLTIAAAHDGRIYMRTADGGGAVMDPDSLAIWWAGVDEGTVAAVNDRATAEKLIGLGGDVRLWEIGEGIAEWLGHRGKADRLPNLLPVVAGSRESRRSIPGLSVAVFLLGIAVCGKLAMDAIEYRILEAESARLETAIQDEFTAAFPEERRVVNARSQFRQKIRELQQAGGASGDFQMLLATVAQSMGAATIEELVYRDEALEVLCSVNNFAELDRLKQVLENAGPVQVELVSSGSLGERVTGRYRITRSLG